MAKGKYQQWMEPEGLILITGWARDGLNEAQIAKNMGVAMSTLSEWKNRYSEISEALKKGKEVADREVENALYKKCLGYNVKIKKTFKVKKVEFDPKSGKKIAEREELKTGEDEVHVPADTTAQIYWLKNRKPSVWREKPEAGGGGEGVQIIDDL